MYFNFALTLGQHTRANINFLDDPGRTERKDFQAGRKLSEGASEKQAHMSECQEAIQTILRGKG